MSELVRKKMELKNHVLCIFQKKKMLSTYIDNEKEDGDEEGEHVADAADGINHVARAAADAEEPQDDEGPQEQLQLEPPAREREAAVLFRQTTSSCTTVSFVVVSVTFS